MEENLKASLEWLKDCAENGYIYETGDSKLLLDYITNLQEEIERLLKKSYKDDVIITKAIEFIKEHQRKDEFLNLNEWQTRDLLNILQGGDKE